MKERDKNTYDQMMQEIVGYPEDYEKTIHHYTSPEGLLGILQEKKIVLHFTKYISLNDKKEGDVLEERYKEVCQDLEKNGEISVWMKQYLLQILKMGFLEIEKNAAGEDVVIDQESLFVCCFSEENDSLPMWNYYVKGGEYQGYCLGFENLADKCKTKGIKCLDLSLYKIQYDNDILYNHMLNCVKEIRNRIIEKKSIQEIKNVIRTYLAEGVLIHKNKCFSHEKEMRIVFHAKGDFLNNIKYKTKKGVLVPYIELEFDKTALTEITVGPLMENELAKKNLEAFLKQHGYNDVKIKPSNVPIRY